MVDLIYCADGNRRFAEIAISAGFKYGARLPARGLHFAPFFADQDWKRPNRDRYITELARHRPHMATVRDLECADQLPEVLSWAEDAALYVSVVLIVPKVSGIISHLPRTIGGTEVRLAYSVPTKYGGAYVPAWEFGGWPVHLLGGSPHAQMRLAYYFNVASVDGNYTNKMAVRWNQFWTETPIPGTKDKQWPRLAEVGERIDADAPYEAFRRSCENIVTAWRRLSA
jgi:hypothetical protein